MGTRLPPRARRWRHCPISMKPGSCIAPTFTPAKFELISDARAAQYNCGCGGCPDWWRHQKVNYCHTVATASCYARAAPGIVVGCRIAQRMGMGGWAGCALAAGSAEIVNCSVGLALDRFNQCGVCG
jgi:hypothetical protein